MVAIRKSRRRQEQLLVRLMIGALITAIATGALFLGNVYVEYKINQNQQSIEALSKELDTLESEISKSKSEQEAYKKQIEELQAQLNQYQEWIIPE